MLGSCLKEKLQQLPQRGGTEFGAWHKPLPLALLPW